MDQQWRSMPPSPPICPVCSISHFPFCSHHHNPYPPPPPPYQQPPPPRYPYPGYPQPDPYYQSNPPPPSYYPPRPNNTLHTNPNFDHNQGFAPSVYDYSNIKSNNYGFVAGSEFDRSYKRPRVDDFGGSPQGRVLPEDERRLKLIRDHGGVGLDFDKVHSNFDNLRNREVGSVNRSNNDARDLYSPFQPDHQVPQRPNSMPDYMRPDYLSSCGGSKLHEVGGYLPEHRGFGGQPPPPPPPPPLPLSPPPPYPVASPVSAISDYKTYPLPPNTSFSLFPVRPNSLETNSYSYNKMCSRGTAGFASEEWQSSSRQYQGDGQAFSQKQLSPEKATIVDASHLFKPPYRATRPDHFVVILRGLPGSGKSYLAKLMRDLEVENGGTAPRIHSMDDYFMTEVEKAEDSDASKSSGSGRGKKPIVKRVMEYCYEPEMEEAYRDSMLKAFKKTLDEGVFTFVIVDDRNLRVADFAQFWAIAKRSGYEVYISEATYKDPAGCAARNVHGFTLEEIQNMSAQWEEAPSFYLHLDIKTLFGGDDLKESGIQEVDMDTEEGDLQNDLSGLQEKRQEKALITPAESDSVLDCKLCDNEEDHPTEGVKELGKSKWSHELDEKNTEESENIKGNLSALSGLVQAYKKQGKSVRWSDQEEDTGFSIRAAKRANVLSLVIGPGSGYNLKSNPLADEESIRSGQNSGKPRRSAFQDRLRAEKESFKAVFDKRRQRIGGLHLDEE